MAFDREKRKKQLTNLLLQAYEKPPSERRAFVERACGDDGWLLKEALAELDRETELVEEEAGLVVEETELVDPSASMSRPDGSSGARAGSAPGTFTDGGGASAGPSAETLEAGRSLGEYTILARLGAGGMGEVYRARDTELRREVALKVLQPSLTRDELAMGRFRREARLLASVNHPHIATIHGFGEAEGVHFLVMELVAGENLANELGTGPLSLPRALQINLQIARALEAAHKRGVIHRDLKPANVMVTPDGWVKVLDFGIAKALGTEVAETEAEGMSPKVGESRPLTVDVTITGRVVGTIPYMSPERVMCEKSDHRSDIWAFGCVLFETLAGRRPFDGASRMELLIAIADCRVRWDVLPPNLPPALRTLLERCLEKKVEDRLQSIDEARAEIESLLGGSLSAADPAWMPSRNLVPGGQEGVRAGLGTASPSTLAYLDSLDGYTVVERIAVGGQGELYRAWDRERKRDVAIKVLRPDRFRDPEARAKLRQEAQALSWLRHPNIANLYDFGTAERDASTGESESAEQDENGGGIDFLVTEYIAGATLATRLADGALPEGVLIRLGYQIATALGEAHEQGILHRDVKTSNVMVTPDGQAKLIDFGLATDHESPEPARRKNLSSSGPRRFDAHGPLSYRAPETLQGEDGDGRSDLYSLGVVLYKMATGVRPFVGDNEAALTEAILRQAPTPPRQVQPALSKDLDAVILRCLEKDPAKRFATAAELASALESLSPMMPTGPLTGWQETGRYLSGTYPLTRNDATPPTWLGRLLGRPAAVVALLLVAVVTVALLVHAARRPSGGSSLAQIESVVVMPTRLLDDGESPFLADAIPNAMSSYLSRVPGIEAKLPPTSFDIERLGGDLSKVADAYGAQAMVLSTASVRQGQRVLELQLVAAPSRTLLWDHSVRVEGSTYSALALDGAEHLAQALRPGQEAASVAEELSPEVEQHLQQGRYYSNLYRNRGRGGDKERALQSFEQALALDPQHADAAGEIAMLHTVSLDLGVSVLEVLPEVRAWAQRALDIDPRCSKAWAALGYVEGGRQAESYRRQLEYLLKAATFGPRDGYSAGRLSRPLAAISFTLALATSQRASSLEPLVLTSIIFESVCLGPLGRRDEALARVEDALDIEPGMPFGLLFRGLLLSVGDREEEALALVTEALDPLATEGKLHPSWVALARDYATFARASRTGDTETADRLASRLVATAQGELPFPRWEMVTVEVAAQLAKWGRPEEALQVIQLRGDRDIFQPYDYLLFSPELSPIRDDPRFQVVLERSRLHFEEILAILEEARVKGELPTYLERPLADLLRRIRRMRQAA